MSSGLALEGEGGRWKRYPAYKDSGVEWLGVVPEGWDVLRLKNVTHFGYGNSLAADDRVPGNYYVYGSNGIVGRHEQPNTKGPCLIIGRKGSFGKVAYSEKSCFAIDTTYFVDSTLTNNNLQWLYYCLQWLQLDSFTKDSAVPGLSREDAYENRVPFCSVDEQRTIAAFLDRETGRIDALIAKKERQIGLLQEKRAALISHAVTKGLDPDAPMKDSGVEWLGEVPEEWGVIKLNYVVRGITVGFVGPIEAYYTDETGVPLLKTGDIGLGIISFETPSYVTKEFHDSNPKSKIISGDIIIARHGESGKAAMIPKEIIEGNCLNVVILRTSASMNGKFVVNLLNSTLYQQYFKAKQGGSVQGVINTSDVIDLRVVFPPLDEQERIAKYLDSVTHQIDNLIVMVRESITKLREYRTALISAAVTGKIDVREELVS